MPVILASPTTSSFDTGFVVPIPRLPEIFNCCDVKLVADVTPNVVIPETLS